ncbi:MAG: phosphoribosylamine--glycine ligase [Akkermansiaceae bacterium]|nr:phosphoribosylamine--glycine ligase [Akkermansiaceae bacterium]MCP5550364.1 phosphoribosylamine--glycine ligase [Akkermansiaceae bacterium]
MKVLVVGKGGREHAIITALHESPTETEIHAFPGSDAIFAIAKPADASDLPSLIAFLKRESFDLCVAGEESYLVTGEGLANACRAAGIPCWGPPKEAAQLEASKEFAKRFMVRHGIPTGGYAAVDSVEAAREAIGGKYPTVLKFDGLAAGKGVAVCPDEAAAETFIDEVLARRKFGEGRLLVEEFLDGPEISIFASVVDAEYQILAPARDYKRIGDGDAGPNTGGMGAVSSLEMLDAELRERIDREIVRPTVEGLQRDGLPYRGFLYFGLMLTADGPKILEYNCRFGDPEAQAVLPMITGDFARYVFEGAKGNLSPDLIGFRDGWSVCLVSASAGYPESSHSGDIISGLDALEEARIFHAGTRKNAGGQFETAGGRVYAIVARGATRAVAVATVYRESDKVSFDGMQRRSDIGTRNF